MQFFCVRFDPSGKPVPPVKIEAQSREEAMAIAKDRGLQDHLVVGPVERIREWLAQIIAERALQLMREEGASMRPIDAQSLESASEPKS